MGTFSSKKRLEQLSTMSKENLDILVIGGGITGSGIALDATTRGMKVGLVEMQDFAAGTSSRSTKLVHGGLRYLKQFEVKMVAEVGKERAIVYENGPHVTTPEWMLLPIQDGGTFGKFSTSIGLKVYDFLADVKKNERRSMLSASETHKREPLLRKEGLKGGGYYVEYRTDDARLTIEVIKQAVDKGALAVNYAKVEKLLYDNGKVVGAEVVDQLTNKAYKIFAKKVVNAAGPWVDSVREMDQSKKGKHLQLTKGIHLVFDQSVFPLKQAIYFDTPDKRMVFAIPRDGKTYVGTTDTVYNEDMANPRLTKADKEYVIKAINFMFPGVGITEKDIESSWSGLRPLIHESGKSASEISRKDEIWESESGLITIAGGKLTGYRKMAEMVVDLLNQQFIREGVGDFGKCQTKYLPISGGDVGGSKNLPAFIEDKTKEGVKLGLTNEQSQKLAKLYGSNVDSLFALVDKYNEAALTFGLPLDVYAQVMYAIHEEMTVTPSDFFIRRTGALLFNMDWVHQWKQKVAELMANELNWSNDQLEHYQIEIEMFIHQATTAVDEDQGDGSSGAEFWKEESA
ncbi:glycerol-3-phosphate dehydrogenase/oxidase [Neobacillus bataviensis]|uniref:glycerol-3-phosphate dehydrogenase/oxidase n=1 Tax=Neobacillus bataviensis TaxID=220685 RepID=UPI001CBD0B9E|nr:glycerol-3-phosphate dehydrogenase/oxidase [Neobacillus bataviensis]